MIKNLLFVCCFVAGLLFATAQERKDLPDGACGADALHLKLLKENPDYKEKFDKNNALWQEWAPKHTKVPIKAKNSNASRKMETSAPVILQVVFHNMHCPANDLTIPNSIIDYQIIVDKLNAIYSGSLPGTYSPSQNNTNIQFCLAKQDVFGNSYGNTPHLTDLATIDYNEIDQIKTIATDSESLLTFPRTKYISIYLVDAILGHPAFAFLPSSHG